MTGGLVHVSGDTAHRDRQGDDRISQLGEPWSLRGLPGDSTGPDDRRMAADRSAARLLVTLLMHTHRGRIGDDRCWREGERHGCVVGEAELPGCLEVAAAAHLCRVLAGDE